MGSVKQSKIINRYLVEFLSGGNIVVSEARTKLGFGVVMVVIIGFSLIVGAVFIKNNLMYLTFIFGGFFLFLGISAIWHWIFPVQITIFKAKGCIEIGSKIRKKRIELDSIDYLYFKRESLETTRFKSGPKINFQNVIVVLKSGKKISLFQIESKLSGLTYSYDEGSEAIELMRTVRNVLGVEFKVLD